MSESGSEKDRCETCGVHIFYNGDKWLHANGKLSYRTLYALDADHVPEPESESESCDQHEDCVKNTSLANACAQSKKDEGEFIITLRVKPDTVTASLRNLEAENAPSREADALNNVKGACLHCLGAFKSVPDVVRFVVERGE